MEIEFTYVAPLSSSEEESHRIFKEYMEKVHDALESNVHTDFALTRACRDLWAAALMRGIELAKSGEV